MIGLKPLFEDRADAGRKLAQTLAAMRLERPVIFALPRGGVAVGAEVAKALGAPLEPLIVRKIGAPGQPELALGAVIDGADDVVINEDVRRLTGADDAYIEAAKARELAEIARRRTAYMGESARVAAAGRTAIVVDDGLATGATAKAALRALRRQGAFRTVLAVPVAPLAVLPEMRSEADDVVCLEPVERFRGVGAFYGDFHQMTDAETIDLLLTARGRASVDDPIRKIGVRLPPAGLAGGLRIPTNPRGLVLFAHGSGSSRLSPRNRAVAEDLNRRGIATLLFDLLTDDEAQIRRNVFDVSLMAQRLEEAVAWIDLNDELAVLPLGFFGASTGAAAALRAAAALGDRVRAVVSRGGRPDLADASDLERVSAPTLLIVGAQDAPVIALNETALSLLNAPKALKLVPGATHLFEEPGALEAVMELAGDWFERRLRADGRRNPAAAARPIALRDRIRAAAVPLPDPGDPAFGAAFDRLARSRVVMLGECSHGSSEFYRARAAITLRLVGAHGFDMVAIEADWPDVAVVDRYVRGLPPRTMETPPFSRFPTWMWRNTDFADFVRRLQALNATRPSGGRAAIYGLDLYNMRASMAAVLDYLQQVDPKAAAAARDRYACLDPWSGEPSAYGRAAMRRGLAPCEGAVLATLSDLMCKWLDYADRDGERLFDAAQNARLVADAERYYRAMYFGSAKSWNLRDRHMFETLEMALAARGPGSRAVVWAHNSHIGDARATAMGVEHGELNIGQLARERFGADVSLVGFGSHSGTVRAAGAWDEPGRVMQVRPSRPDSFERLFHESGAVRALLDIGPQSDEALRQALREPRLERYIGVIYRPDSERASHYALSSLAEQYDAFVWFDETAAVEPLPPEAEETEDETYPFGL